MALQNSFNNSTMETSLVTSKNSSSHSRRKSLHVQKDTSTILLENNDEAERLERRCEKNTFLVQAQHLNTSNKRKSLNNILAQMSLPEMKDCITECIKLNSENKINAKNAFSLRIIDLMTHMIRNHDTNMSNLQVASTSLDVSAKIYGLRVDGVYTDIIKMSGGLDKEDEKSTDNVTEHKNEEEEHELKNSRKQSKKKKKGNKEGLFSTINVLRGTVEIMKPTLWTIESTGTQSSDTLYQVAQLNNANTKFYSELHNGIIADIVEDTAEKRTEKVPIFKIACFSDKEICPSLTTFEYQDWMNDNEIQQDKDVVDEHNNKGNFQFDLDANVSSEDEAEVAGINYLDIHDEEEIVEKCIAIEKPVESIADLCRIISKSNANKTSEYSFLQKCSNINWAGPGSHWKMSNLRQFQIGSKIVGTCQQEVTKRTKDIELTYDDCQKQSILEKFQEGKALRLNVKKSNWCEEINTLPRDVHYSVASANKLYFHKLIVVNKSEERNFHVTDMTSFIDEYDYNNENDTSDYCPNISNKDHKAAEGNEDECNFKAAQSLVGDNLIVAAKMTNKVPITYNTQATKIDMRQLKDSIWQSLNFKSRDVQSNENQEKQETVEESRQFSNIYKALPNILTKTNRESLSFPISFISLLHLANEKIMKIQPHPNMTDLIVNYN